MKIEKVNTQQQNIHDAIWFSSILVCETWQSNRVSDWKSISAVWIKKSNQ